MAEIKNESYFKRLGRNIVKHKAAYIMVLPVLIYYILFCYVPMYGTLMAFQDYDPAWGILGSPWVGFSNFVDFFTGEYFFRLVKNTLTISISSLVFGFPAPILLALLINEFRSKKFVKTVQTITYLPHFISLVVVCAMIKNFVSADGIIGGIYSAFHDGDKTSMLMKPELFVPIYVISDIWQGVGWGSIIYFAALTGIDSELYEACTIDGGGRFRQMVSVTLPGIMNVIMLQLILDLGCIMSDNYDQIMAMINSSQSLNSTTEVVGSLEYDAIVNGSQYSKATAYALIRGIIGLSLVLVANNIAKKTDNEGVL